MAFGFGLEYNVQDESPSPIYSVTPCGPRISTNGPDFAD
jgi:hypothetical protein